MSEVQARLRAALVAIAEEDVDWLYRKTIEDAIATLDDGIRPEEDAEGTVSAACAAVGRLDLLRTARALGYPSNALTCVKAAKYGHLECLKYAHEQGCPWDKKTCCSAAGQGQLECLKYLHERGCPWDEVTCYFAAKYGHLECLKYAHEHGCPWDDWTCEGAARYGHLECLKYAHERGCPWDAKTYFRAVSNGNMEVILFLIEREHPHAQSLRLTWEKVAMPILPDADAVIGLEIALSRHRHRHDADGGHVSLREILPFWREHRRLYDEAHRAARVDALLPEIDKERRRLTDAG